MNDTIAAAELLQFIERIEALSEEKQGIADDIKEVYAEAKSRGYSTPVIREIVKLRKKRPDDVAEFQAIMDVYLSSLGMA